MKTSRSTVRHLIFYQHPDVIDGPIASGTYFAIRKRVFLITAGHTITEFKFEPKNFLVPDRPKSSEFTDLGNCTLLMPDDDGYDVCALAFSPWLRWGDGEEPEGGDHFRTWYQHRSVHRPVTVPVLDRLSRPDRLAERARFEPELH
jgi:hypothetical protein